jgi:hypothetical protein
MGQILRVDLGGKDRRDATDPRCGPDGQLRDGIPSGETVPKATVAVIYRINPLRRKDDLPTKKVEGIVCGSMV